jgi:heterogeneous nuclear ribonucleoprotein K
MSHHNSVDENAIVDLRFLIPSRAAGVIIGKGGENVKEIRDKYEIEVSLPDTTGPERVLNINGGLASVMEALESLLEKLQDFMQSNDMDGYNDANKNRNRGRRSKNQRDDDDVPSTGDSQHSGLDLRMLIHQNQAGSVIGRGGEQIKELREKTSLRNLKVYQVCCPHSTERVVQMVGEVPRVIQCVRSVIDKIHAFQMRGNEQIYDARNFDESQALSYGGWLSKGAQRTVQEYGVHALSHLSPGSALPGGHMGPSAFAAFASARANMMNPNVQSSNHGGAMHSHSAAMAAAANPMMMMSMMMPAALPGTENRRGGNSSGYMDRSGVKTVHVSVPNSYMGAIMGKKGVRIRSIREESGADIRVHEPDGADRIIDISGTPSQIAYAQQLLKSCVLLYHEKK